MFRTFSLDSHFQNHPDLVILQKYQSLSNQSFKHNSTHIPFLNLTSSFLLNLGFACSSLTVTTEKANVWRLSTPCFQSNYIKAFVLHEWAELSPKFFFSRYYVTVCCKSWTDLSKSLLWIFAKWRAIFLPVVPAR